MDSLENHSAKIKSFSPSISEPENSEGSRRRKSGEVFAPAVAPLNAKSQRARILRLFVEAHGAWVPLPRILALGFAQFGARILELRRSGFHIENRIERDDSGVIHSAYRLVNDLPNTDAPKLEPAKPATEWKARQRFTGLPLFDATVRV